MITSSNNPGISVGAIAGVVVAFVSLLIIYSSIIIVLGLYYKVRWMLYSYYACDLQC